MGLKKLLWNDNATELFGHRRDQNAQAASERPGEGTASHRPYTARKVLKGSAAFTSALLFGNGESQGLVRTFGQASAEAGKGISGFMRSSTEEDRPTFAPPEANLNDGRTSTTFGHYYDSFGNEIDD
ncbi:hypothetical protein R5R73_01975 [Salinicola sp. LHM]|uniref:hypothetical protein n=1 Tax=Salinicola sp. LHM TaxID=3065298 RepID=UPI002ACDCD88|nr:hypothetical protein [Salinicola sp. LHM]WQH33483.1 hypothetical protein R5R73_01975 [Salinicola sp. LHM]